MTSGGPPAAGSCRWSALGVYHVADDEAAPARDRLPVLGAAVGSPPPCRVPAWLAQLAEGRFVVARRLHGRGASSSKAKAELGWAPSRPTGRTGFYESAR